ncbi:MAG: GntR family transcriptional regulator [Planctomycetes bacterium]|nr:GntR family transcriptional regulator [Planctomycetota bacterium]
MKSGESASSQVADRIRNKIIDGLWTAGSRLPPRVEMIAELGSNATVVQQAVTRLAEEGFLVTRSRKKGTLVVERLPHRCHFRLIYPYGKERWGQFFHAVEDAIATLNQEELRFSGFYGLSRHGDIAEYEAIIDEVKSQRVAGLIFLSGANEYRGTPLLDAPGVHRVALTQKKDLPGVPKVELDRKGFIKQAVDHLKKNGKARTAILCSNTDTEMTNFFRKELARNGMTGDLRWEQYADIRNPVSAYNIIRLMVGAEQQCRPDSLIVTDDNLITAAAQAVHTSGLAENGKFSLVTMSNFPRLVDCCVPVTHIGFDIPAVMESLISILQNLVDGKGAKEHAFAPAITQAQFEKRRLGL